MKEPNEKSVFWRMRPAPSLGVIFRHAHDMMWGCVFGFCSPSVLVGGFIDDKNRLIICSEAKCEGSNNTEEGIYQTFYDNYFGDNPIYAPPEQDMMILRMQKRGLPVKPCKTKRGFHLKAMDVLRGSREIIIDPQRCPNECRMFVEQAAGRGIADIDGACSPESDALLCSVSPLIRK